MKLTYGHKVYGAENITDEAGIIAANHVSFYDPPLIGISSPKEVHFLARSTLFNFPLFGWLIRSLNSHPIKRGRENASMFKMALDPLKDGKKLVVFPEGSRSKDGEIHEGQLGIAMLVLRANVKVFPAYIGGAYEIWSVKRKLPKLKGKTAVVFGKALDFSDVEADGKKEAQEIVTKRIMQKIVDLKEWYEKGAKGSPP